MQVDCLWSIEEARFGQIIESMRGLNIAEAIRLRGWRSKYLPMDVEDGIGIVNVAGPLFKGAGPAWYFGGSSLLQIQAAVEKLAADDKVKAILMQVDSPGGSVDGLAELGDAIFAAREAKPIWAQVTGIAASAAYYIASQANRIIAQRMDLIGSIGIRMLVYDFSKLFEDAGIRAIPIDTGEFKSAGAMGTEITERQQEYFRSIVQAYFEDFVAAVVRGRRISKKAVKEVADGRVMPAAEALAAGLIDEIQNMDVTLDALRGSVASKRSRGRVAAANNPAEREGITGKDVVMSDDMRAATQTGTKSVEAATPKAPDTKPAEPSAAGYEELVSACKGADAEFICGQLERKATVAQAQAAWMETQAKRLEASQAEVANLKAEKAQPGVEALGTPAKAGTTEDAGDAIQRWEAAVDAKVKTGMDKAKATRAVVHEDPELHKEYLEAYNAGYRLRIRKVG